MNEKWLIVCPLIDENCNARYWSFPCTIVCNKKTLRVLFLPLVRNVLGKFMLKLLLVEAYGNKVQQVCLVVVGLESSLICRVLFVVVLGSTTAWNNLWATQWDLVCFGLHKPMSLHFLHASVHFEGWQWSTTSTFTRSCCRSHGFWILDAQLPSRELFCTPGCNIHIYAIRLHLKSIGRENTLSVMVMVRLTICFVLVYHFFLWCMIGH